MRTTQWFHITGYVKDQNHVLLTLYYHFMTHLEREFENTQNLLSRLRGENELHFSLFSLLRTEPLAHALNQAAHKQNRKVIILI